jgi:hypothetical protein
MGISFEKMGSCVTLEKNIINGTVVYSSRSYAQKVLEKIEKGVILQVVQFTLPCV